MANIGTPIDPKKQQNANNLEEIKHAVKKPHWTMVPMFLMTLIILLLTAWMAYSQYTSTGPDTPPPATAPAIETAG